MTRLQPISTAQRPARIPNGIAPVPNAPAMVITAIAATAPITVRGKPGRRPAVRSTKFRTAFAKPALRSGLGGRMIVASSGMGGRLPLPSASGNRKVATMKLALRSLTLALLLATPAILPAQGPDLPAMAAERTAMARLAWMDGVWRGPATTQLPTGAHSVTQTERIGPMLGGGIKVVEGRGFNPDGTTGFNAFGVISYNPATQAYTLHSYALATKATFRSPSPPTAMSGRSPPAR